MSGQVILITGAPAGIGRATALAVEREGYKIVVSGRNSQTGTALAHGSLILDPTKRVSQ